MQVETKQSLTKSGREGTYLRNRVHGVEEISSQISDRVFFGELGEAPNSLVDILFLHQVFRDASRIFQARISPQLGAAVLQGLNSTLYEKRHELNTR
jgi:hypothetical protein